MRTFNVVSLVLAAVLSGTAAGAQSWVAVGPPGGTVRTLAADPADPLRVYLGTEDGMLFRSEDGGLNWNGVRPGFPQRQCSLDQIAVDARGVVFVGYWEVQGKGGGVARSLDHGQSFELLKGIQGESVRAVALAPATPHMIAAGTRRGVFLSHDDGRVWTRITPEGHPDLLNVESLAFDPNDSRILYVGTWHLAWKTIDAGATWTPVHDGMIDDSDVMTLTLDRWNPQTIYATACSGIYRSVSGATRWSQMSGIPSESRRTRAFCQGDDDPNLLLAGTTKGLWISEDGGDSWRLSTPVDMVINTIVAQPGGTLLIGTDGAGVLRSSDRGKTWIASNAGFSAQFVSRMLFDLPGRQLFVTVWGSDAVFVSPGTSGPWSPLPEGLRGRHVLSLAMLEGALYAGTDDGVFLRDRGAWSRRPIVLEGREAHLRVTDLLALPSHRLLAATAQGLILSADEGRTWTRPKLGKPDEVFALAVFPRDSSRVLAATRSGFFRSVDGGDNWTMVASALSGAIPHALTVTATREPMLFATTTTGLFRSDDEGATWSRATGGIPSSNLTGITVHPDGRTVYASDFNWGGIFRSADGGLTWERMPTGDLPSDRVWALGLDPESPDRVLASSAAGLHLFMPAMLAGGAGQGSN